MRDKKANKPEKAFFKVLYLTLLLSISIYAFIVLYRVVFAQDTELLSLFWLWVVAVLVGTVTLMKKSGVDVETISVLILLGGFAAVIGFYFVPDELKLQPKYLGLKTRLTLEMIETGPRGTSVDYLHRLKPRGLYLANDTGLPFDVKELKQFNDQVEFSGFLTWQLGYLEGFKPYGIPGYYRPSSLLDKVFFFFNVGFISACEVVFMGIYQFFLILLFYQAIWLAIKKETFWNINK